MNDNFRDFTAVSLFSTLCYMEMFLAANLDRETGY